MGLARAELIIHPVRLRILQTLAGEKLTTQDLGERLPDIPQSSLYRHLRLLRRGGVVEVVEKRLVNGIEEKIYAITGNIRLEQDEMDGLSSADHLRYFTTYVLVLIRGFDAYLAASESADGQINMQADYAGYTELAFYASSDELQQFQQTLHAALLPLLHNEAAADRRRHKIAVITHPTGDDRERAT